MASKPAVEVGFLFAMATNAEAHLKGHAFDPVHGLHFAVALLTKDLFLDMSPMVEKDMLWEIIHFDPGRWRFGIEIPVLLLDLRVIRDDVLVTIEAFFDWRYPRVGRTVYIGMTEVALNLLYPRMHLVTEWNRLFGAQAPPRHDIEKVKKKNYQARATKGEHDGIPVPHQCLSYDPG